MVDFDKLTQEVLKNATYNELLTSMDELQDEILDYLERGYEPDSEIVERRERILSKVQREIYLRDNPIQTSKNINGVQLKLF